MVQFFTFFSLYPHRDTSGVGGLTAAIELTLWPAPNYSVCLPFIMSNHSTHQLVVEAITHSPLQPTIHTPVVVSVTIRNLGSATLDDPFWVDLYLDPQPAPQVGNLWNEICLYGKAWYVQDPIPAGGALVLHTGLPDDPGNPDNRYSNWPTVALGVGPHTLWAQVDTYPAPPGMYPRGE